MWATCPLNTTSMPPCQRVAYWDVTHGWEIAAYTYWGSTPVEFDEAGYAQYEHQDWLGTERLRTRYDGSVDGSFVSLPFGDGIGVTSGIDNDPYHFAGLDYDYWQQYRPCAVPSIRKYVRPLDEPRSVLRQLPLWESTEHESLYVCHEQSDEQYRSEQDCTVKI